MNKILYALVGAAVLAQIVYPLVDGPRRDVVTVAVVVLLATAALAHAAVTRGTAWALMLFVTTAGLGLAAEIVGTATGFPFGSYFYATGRLGPDIFGVPAVVPLAWTAGFYPIWCAVAYVSRRTTATPRVHAVQRVVLTAAGMVGWDLYLDTQMVTDGHWTWTADAAGLPGIPSIPVTNYLGWFATAAIMTVVVDTLGGRLTAPRSAPSPVSDAAPVVLFLWTWLGSAVAHAVLLTGPEFRYSAMYGFVAMGIVGGPLVWTWFRTSALWNGTAKSRATPPRRDPDR